MNPSRFDVDVLQIEVAAKNKKLKSQLPFCNRSMADYHLY
jgi:hypothetical protein